MKTSELQHLFRALKAPAAARALSALAARAREEDWSHERFLEAVLATEVSSRESHGGESRIKAARFPARKTLEEALATFEELGASLWSAQTRRELGRISGRTPSRGELTPTEWRVAELVAEGRTNQEVAAALYVAPRTVEGTLSRVYTKLGVRSRTELARRLAAPPK